MSVKSETRSESRTRWLALFVLCGGTLMIVLDSTIVNVALPSIREDLGFSEASLAWVVNAYLLTFGGFLLLGGRLGDIYGHRRMFQYGLVLFTVASLGCGLAQSQEMLIVGRAVQGLGGAVVSAVGAVADDDDVHRAGGARQGDGRRRLRRVGRRQPRRAARRRAHRRARLALDLPRQHPDRRRGVPALPRARSRTGGQEATGRLDVAGAVTVTAALMLAVYAIVNGNETGWLTAQTLGLLAVAAVLLGVFLLIESRVESPLVPLSLFKRRNVAWANVVGMLWAAGMFAWFFLSALYLQLVLGYSPLQVGLAFLPSNLIMGAFSVGISAKLVMKFGIRLPLAVGLSIAAVGLLLFARAPVDGTFLVDVLPSMLLLGVGAGMAFNPVLLAAMSDVEPTDAGLASGVVNTSFMMGGALGLAILASLAAARSETLRDAGTEALEALNAGYHAAFVVGAIFALTAAAIGGLLLRVDPRAAAQAPH